MDYATEGAGASVCMATCTDERHPPDNIVEDDDRSFWVTTGLFPQEFIIAMDGVVSINKIKTLTTNVRKLCVERSDSSQPEKFERLFEVELGDRGSRMQTEVHQVSTAAKYLKFIINSGWDDFCAVHRVSVLGDRE